MHLKRDWVIFLKTKQVLNNKCLNHKVKKLSDQIRGHKKIPAPQLEFFRM